MAVETMFVSNMLWLSAADLILVCEFFPKEFAKDWFMEREVLFVRTDGSTDLNNDDLIEYLRYW
jgi:hypothetical protein